MGGGQSSTVQNDLMGRATHAEYARCRIARGLRRLWQRAEEWTYVQTDGETKYAVRTYTYDLLGRVLTAKEYEGLYAYGATLGDAYATTTYAYEQDRQTDGRYSNVMTTADGLRTVTTYNQLDQVIKEEQYGKGQRVRSADAGEQVHGQGMDV